MAEEKILSPNPKSAFMVLGVVAIVYVIVDYLITIMDWQTYLAWIVGGVILVLIGWAKGSTRG